MHIRLESLSDETEGAVVSSMKVVIKNVSIVIESCLTSCHAKGPDASSKQMPTSAIFCLIGTFEMRLRKQRRSQRKKPRMTRPKY